MPPYVMLSRHTDVPSHNGKGTPEVPEWDLALCIRRSCPDVVWLANYAVRGPYDHVDVFYAPEDDVALEVRTIMRTVGKAEAEVWVARESQRFSMLARDR